MVNFLNFASLSVNLPPKIPSKLHLLREQVWILNNEGESKTLIVRCIYIMFRNIHYELVVEYVSDNKIGIKVQDIKDKPM